MGALFDAVNKLLYDEPP